MPSPLLNLAVGSTSSVEPSAADLVLGFALLISFIAASHLTSSLFSFTDENKREAPLSRGVPPPEHVLTDEGKRRAKQAKIAWAVFGLLVVVVACKKILAG